MSTVELEITPGNSLENINEEILGPSDQVHNPGPGYLEAFVLNVHGIMFCIVLTYEQVNRTSDFYYRFHILFLLYRRDDAMCRCADV